MARKSNGHASEEVGGAVHQQPLSAVQDLIGAIGTTGVEVLRFNLGGYHILLYAVKHRVDLPDEHRLGNRPLRRASIQSAAAGRRSKAEVSLDAVIDVTLGRLQISRIDLISGGSRRA